MVIKKGVYLMGKLRKKIFCCAGMVLTIALSAVLLTQNTYADMWFPITENTVVHTGKSYNALNLEEAIAQLDADPSMATTLENIYAISHVRNNTAFLGGITNKDVMLGWFPTDAEITAMQTENPDLYWWMTAIKPAAAEDGSIPLSQLREWYIIHYSMILDGTMQQLWAPYFNTQSRDWVYRRCSVTIKDGYYSRTLAEATAVIQSYLQTTTASWPFVDCTEWLDYSLMNIPERSPYPVGVTTKSY